MAHLHVSSAREEDLDSLSSLVPRAFHKNNEYFRTTLPDTPLLRQWWANLIRDAIQDPIIHVLTIIDTNDDGGGSGNRHAVGILLLRHVGADGNGENVFLRHPATVDHDQARYAALLDSIGQGPQERLRAGRSYFSLDLFGVDDRYQGYGLGKKLLQKACDLAEDEGIDVFVQANTNASPFYEKRGFECVKTVILPGPEKYGEAFLLYKARRNRRE